MPLLEDELNLAIKNGVTSITDRFKWLTNYKNFIVTGKTKNIDLNELNQNLEEAKIQLNSLKNENIKYDPNHIDDGFNFEKINQTLNELGEEIKSSVQTIKIMKNLCSEDQKPNQINENSIKATHQLLKTTQMIKNSFSSSSLN